MPICCFSRSKRYPEYHTNKDNFNVVTQKGLEGSFKIMKKIIDELETGTYPIANSYCEPNLSKRKLYPTFSQKGNISKILKIRMDLIAYSDGKTNLYEIAEILKLPYIILRKEYNFLKSKKILK